MFTTTNAKHVLVAGNVARTASASIDPNSANYIADGEVVIVSSAGTVLDSTTVLAEDKIRIVQRSGDQVFYSPTIKGSDIASYKGSAYATDVEQVSYVGYNGTSGAIDAITSNDYLVRIVRQDTQATYLNKEMLKFGAYRSLATTTQELIAKGLVDSLIANFSREPEQEIKFERVSSGANTAATGTGTLTFTKGSTTVSAGTDIDAVAVVGDYIRFGTALTDAVYEIVSIDAVANTAVLDVAYQGASGTLAVANFRFVTAANVAAGDMGIKMTGLPRKFKRGVFKFSKVRFVVTLDNFGTTVVTSATEASEGNGTWERSQELEWFASEAANGKVERIGTPPPEFKKDCGDGRSFSTLYVSFADRSYAGIQGTPDSKIELILLLDKGVEGAGFGGQVTGAATDIMNVLDAYAVAKGVGTAQTGNI
jgi:hypothetical protein